MKAAAFQYAAPRVLDEAIALLAEDGGAATILAGGQSLIPLMNMRVISPGSIVDINLVDGLDGLELLADGVKIGALVRQRTLELDPELRRRCPMLTDAAAAVGNVSVRNRGTAVGSIAHGEAAGEWPTVLLALDGTCSVRGPRGERRVPARELFVGPGRTSLDADELIVQVDLRLPDAGSAWVELSRRKGDFPIVGVGAVVTCSSDGRIGSCAVAVGGVASTPIRATEVEVALSGSIPTGRDLVDAARLSAAAFDPPSDVHGSAAYRRQVAPAVIGRALTAAYRRAEERAGR